MDDNLKKIANERQKVEDYQNLKDWALFHVRFDSERIDFLLPLLGCPIFTQISPNLLDRRYVDIYGISKFSEFSHAI